MVKDRNSGSTQRLNVAPTITMMGMVKARLVGATKGQQLLKKKSDAFTMQFWQILKKIVESKESMGRMMKASAFPLTDAKYAARDNIKYVVFENVDKEMINFGMPQVISTDIITTESGFSFTLKFFT